MKNGKKREQYTKYVFPILQKGFHKKSHPTSDRLGALKAYQSSAKVRLDELNLTTRARLPRSGPSAASASS